MIQFGLVMLFAFAAFAVILLAKLESWPPRIILAGIVGGLYHWGTPVYAMIAAAVLSIGVLLHAMLPATSR